MVISGNCGKKTVTENQYQKLQWIEMDVVKNTSDFRPESYRPANIEKVFVVGEKIGTKNDWALRKNIVLKNVHTNKNKQYDISGIANS